MSTSNLDTLISQADDAAANFQAPAPAIQQTHVPTTYSKPSLESLIDGGGLSVDVFTRLKAEGFRLGDDMGGLIEDMVVTIDMAAVTPIKSARFETGGNTKFIKSYDGATTPDGQNFAAVVQNETNRNQKASGVYDTVEIPMVLVEPVVDPKKKKDFAAGTRVGYTPSITGFSPFRDFLKKLRAKNPALLQETLTVKVTHEKRVNAAKNEWGVLNFELIEA